MGFTLKKYMVRVDFFKRSGKWGLNAALDMSGLYEEPLIYDAVKKALDRELEGTSVDWRKWCQNGGRIVVLSPYHRHSHPIMLGYHDAL